MKKHRTTLRQKGTMFQPSEKLCKAVVVACVEFVKAEIHRHSGITPSDAEVLRLLGEHGREMQKTLGKEVHRIFADMQDIGIQYALAKNADCFIEFIDASKHFRPGVEKQFVEQLGVPKSNLSPAMTLLAGEFYDYLKNEQPRSVKVEQDGTMYIDCTPTVDCSLFDGL